MEKIESGEPRIDEVIFQELSGFKLQSVMGGKATKVLKVESKNGKNKVIFADGKSIDFKFLDDQYIKLSFNQNDLTPDQITQVLESRRKKANINSKAFREEGDTEGLVDASDGLSEKDLIEQSKQEAMVGKVEIMPTKPDSPIKALLKKQKENLIPLNLTLQVNLPPQALYDVLIDSYDNAEEEILNFAVDKVDISAIKNSIKEAIKNNYYEDGKDGKDPSSGRTEGEDPVSD